ncbi:hypothetical protein BSPWISOXPB_2743 [uncultured Gammaproteobacteria bacterium]|nr:hypothetical protein BSPWISOXPB_2743 [uncultured Gammaproteobacteria bacterium]
MANSMNDVFAYATNRQKKIGTIIGFFLRCSWVEKGVSIKLFKTLKYRQGKVCALKWYYNPSLCN